MIKYWRREQLGIEANVDQELSPLPSYCMENSCNMSPVLEVIVFYHYHYHSYIAYIYYYTIVAVRTILTETYLAVAQLHNLRVNYYI